MRMLRFTLAWLLALSLALGTWAPLAAAGCAAPSDVSRAQSSADGHCGACRDADGNGPAQAGCAAMFCSAACIAGPATMGDLRTGAFAAVGAGTAPAMPGEALLARAIPPDSPPPR
jgi:hypothetical protein